MQEREFRNKVSWMTFLFSIFVIWVHSYNVELFAGWHWGPDWARVEQMQRAFGEGLGQTAVPGFFMISAYLFFRDYTPEKLWDKWKRRVQGVLIPYVVWNALYYAGYALATRLPLVRSVVGKEPIPISLEQLFEAVFHYSYAPVFWYLYQLILLILLSPVIYAMVEKQWVGAVYLVVLLCAVRRGFDLQNPNMDALFYYSFGGYAAVHGKRLAEGRQGFFGALAGILCLAAAAVFWTQASRPGANVVWTVLFRAAVPVGLWLFISGERLPEARPWMRQSLFLYAIHFIIVRFVNKGTILWLARRGEEEILLYGALILYLVMPVIVTAVSYLLAKTLIRLAPWAWRVLAGGRGI